MEKDDSPIAKPMVLARAPRLVLLASLAVTAMVSYSAYRMVAAEARFGFNQRAEQIRNILQLGMETYVNTLIQTKGFIVANANRVSRESFRNYVDGIGLFKSYPGLQGIGYAIHVSSSEVPQHEARTRASGDPQYRVWPRTTGTEQFPIVYLEPQNARNQRAIGFDMYTEPVRRAAMQTARDSGEPSLSARVTLIQEGNTDHQPGFLMYAPVYQPHALITTVAQRRVAIAGFVHCAFRATDLFDELFARNVQPHWSHMRFELYDGVKVNNDEKLYEYVGADTRSAASGQALFERTLRLQVANHYWTVRVLMLPTETTLSTFLVPLLILGFGLSLSFLLYRILSDMRRRQEMEDQMLKVRNLESIGLLAGGIAHDFNNILTAVLGNISLAKMYTHASDKVHEVLSEAEKATWRARELTHQLLTFAKGGMPIKKAASIAEVVHDTATFGLRGTNIKCDLRVAEPIWPAEFDAGQISQVISNLVINAKQAMPDGGVVIVAAENVLLPADKIFGLPGGRYIKLTVTDTGTGIAPQHINKIFDPYFTTKAEGSGLGLATTYSIVKKHGGHIEVSSRVGIGTTFTIYIPAIPAATDLPDSSETNNTIAGRILLMESEATVRATALSLLLRLGYNARAVTDKASLVREYRSALRAGRRYDVVIIDGVEPAEKKNCLHELREIDADICAVGTNANGDTSVEDFEQWGFCAAVAKPYRGDTLQHAVQLAMYRHRRRKTDASDPALHPR